MTVPDRNGTRPSSTQSRYHPGVCDFGAHLHAQTSQVQTRACRIARPAGPGLLTVFIVFDDEAALAGSGYPIFAPFIGGIGAAVAGSNTVSNMMFSLFQFEIGPRIGVDPSWMVALQAIGGAAGNMICVHNVVAASAVVGLLGREGSVIRLTLMPFVYYALLPGSIGYIIVSYADRGLLNVGAILVTLIAGLAVYVIARHGGTPATDPSQTRPFSTALGPPAGPAASSPSASFGGWLFVVVELIVIPLAIIQIVRALAASYIS